jgi:hypothetical protein
MRYYASYKHGKSDFKLGSCGGDLGVVLQAPIFKSFLFLDIVTNSHLFMCLHS